MPENERAYECPDCGKRFKSLNALNGHKSVCRAGPDEDEDEKAPREDMDDGIKIFEEEDEEPRRTRSSSSEEESEDYVCGACGHKQKREFRFCPSCGVENEF